MAEAAAGRFSVMGANKALLCYFHLLLWWASHQRQWLVEWSLFDSIIELRTNDGKWKMLSDNLWLLHVRECCWSIILNQRGDQTSKGWSWVAFLKLLSTRNRQDVADSSPGGRQLGWCWATEHLNRHFEGVRVGLDKDGWVGIGGFRSVWENICCGRIQELALGEDKG